MNCSALTPARPPCYCSHMSIALNATRLSAYLTMRDAILSLPNINFDGTKLPLVVARHRTTTNGMNRQFCAIEDLVSARSIDPQIAPRHLARRLHVEYS